MSFYGFKPYVPVAERRRKAEKAAAKARKAGAELSPIEPYRGAITKTFWGKAWSENLEAYSDYANRLPRGRTYVRNGSVIDLKIADGEIQAQVMGSSLYKVAIKIAAVAPDHWQALGTDCAGSIDSLVELLQGKLSTAVMQRICAPRTGLFPAPNEISFSCSCPDSVSMCKHVAAVLYGVGARLDHQPELLFRLRQVDAADLVQQAGAGLPKSKKGPAAGKRLDDSMLADVFGIEMDETAAPTKDARPRKEPPAKAQANKAAKTTTVSHSATSKTPPAIRTPATARKAAAAKSPAKESASPRTPKVLASPRRATTSKSASGKAERAVTDPAKKKTGKAVRSSKPD
jgi:uncharacterized Zn finger protein